MQRYPSSSDRKSFSALARSWWTRGTLTSSTAAISVRLERFPITLVHIHKI